MRKRVIIFFSENRVSVDGVSLHFEVTPPANGYCVIQWYGTSGEIEFEDRTTNPNIQLTEDDYEKSVAPFVKLWEAEKIRLNMDTEKQKEKENTPEYLAHAIRQERTTRITATDYLMMPDYPLTEEERITWKQYRAALRNITDIDGFPWEGPRSAPWPEPPKHIQ